jgi:dienelactone hydrolase
MTKDSAKNSIIQTEVDDISICYVLPKEINSIALWIPYLGGNRGTGASEILKLSDQGSLAISFDPWMHGEKYKNNKPSIRTRALKEFRTVMWTVLGNSTLDAMRVIDWAVKRYGVQKRIVAGGLSMGGDIALSLAGIDQRIMKVAGIASSPDWNREGMADVIDGSKIIRQGSQTSYSTWLYEKMNPMSNLNSYRREISIQLEYSKKDAHIHEKWGREFKKEVESKKSKAEIRIISDEEVGHISLIQKKTVIARSIDFLLK